MTSDVLEKAVAAGTKKYELLSHSFPRYCLSSLLAGAYLTIVGFVFWSIRDAYGTDPSGRLISSLFFGVGLSIIVFTATELFTSNNFYLTLSTLAGRTNWQQTARLWAVCWVGNFAGAIIIAFLLFGTGILSSLNADHALMVGASHKINLSSSEIFFKGILANWIVCLAVWVNLQMKEDISRLMSIILIVFIFLYLGFEHSIANLGLFSIAYMADPSLPLAGMAHNLFFSTLGNIVGGACGLGLPIWLMRERTSRPITSQEFQSIQ